MSKEENPKTKTSEKKDTPPISSDTEKKDVWPWGVWRTLFAALGVFILPQFIFGFVLSEQQLDELQTGTNTGLNFSVLVGSELITLSLLMMILRRRGKRLRDLFVVPAKFADVALAVPMFFVYLFVSTIAFTAFSFFLSEETVEMEQNIGFDTASADSLGKILIFLGLVVLVPFIEELLFRGFMLKGFMSRMGWSAAAVLSSLLFGLAHLQLNVAIDTFFLALAAAWLVHFSKSLWPAVLLHSIKNGLAFAFLFNYLEL